ncbi:hypothetical protein E1286_05160 [Nonomuraea terrae]|uniref:Scaffolding protein n=1 Tax=Nonomuraea terrae TaxID=2530383 RepID=A0A4R4Z8F6_9ACTN|nr:hypothetical protein [Nonomuraea terrae]TDD54581.1 hypothetical protein E1286_05160 [Nonomuraea terrae]
MNTAVLPVHPYTGLRAIAVLPSGRVVWPIMGGSGDGGQPQGTQEPATGQPAPVAPATAPAQQTQPGQQPQPTTQQPANDRGYPDNTPVADMTVDQQAAYWKSHARKHEDRLKAIDVTPEELTRLREADAEMQKLADASRTDMERVEARATAAEQKAAAMEPELLRLQAAIKAALPAEVSAKLIAGSRRIVGSTAEEYEADAADYFGSAPIQIAPPAPPVLDQGARQTGKQAPSVAAGRDLWAERHGNKTT